MWGSCQELYFYIFLTGAILNNLIPDNIIELKILKRKYACESSVVKIMNMNTILRVRSSGSAFCRHYQRTEECRR